MRYGINLPPFGDFADPAALAGLARTAEAAGWDGFFIWDHMVFDPSFHPVADPWVALAAVALSTTTIRIGTMLTPVPRRRPWKLARETVSIDRLSNGRLTLGVGIGDPAQWEFGWFGEEQDARTRAAQLDEGLEILQGLWTGEPFGFQGEHYQLHELIFRPRPMQERIPIWVGGNWPNRRPMRRAARWDGACPMRMGAPLTPDDWREIAAYIAAHRPPELAGQPFDLVAGGATTGTDHAADAAEVAALADAGVTWWIESIDPWRFGQSWEAQWDAHYSELMRERVRQGPPRQ